MILTCPACATSYFVPDAAIGPNGRRVRCKSCGHDWHVAPDEPPLDLAEVAAAMSVPPGDHSVQGPLEDDTPPPLPQAFRAREQERRRARQAVRQGLTWGLLVVMLLTLLGVAYIARDAIVTRVPTLASAYKAVGIHTNAVGLEFEALNARFAAHDTTRVVVSGALRNVRDHEIVVPTLRISMRDINGREIGFETMRLDTAPVLPGGVQGFAVVLPNPEGKFASAATTFVIEPKKKAARAAAAPAEAPTVSETGTAPPAAVKAEPAKSEGTSDAGLRRVGDLSPKATGLDTPPPTGVSAGHG